MSDADPVFHGFNLVVADMAAAVDFYRLLGLNIPDTLPEWQDHHRSATGDGEGGLPVDFDLDSVVFAQQWNEGYPGGPGGGMGVLGFRVATREAVDETCQRIADAGYRVQQAPYDAFWGARYAVVQDPDGNAVGVMSPADPAMRRPPEAP